VNYNYGGVLSEKVDMYIDAWDMILYKYNIINIYRQKLSNTMLIKLAKIFTPGFVVCSANREIENVTIPCNVDCAIKLLGSVLMKKIDQPLIVPLIKNNADLLNKIHRYFNDNITYSVAMNIGIEYEDSFNAITNNIINLFRGAKMDGSGVSIDLVEYNNRIANVIQFKDAELLRYGGKEVSLEKITL
jgi:hypothetical protein